MANNYTQNINFRRAHLNPKYMQVLKNLIDHPAGQTRHDVVQATHGVDIFSKSWLQSWNAGPFTLLRENGYAAFKRIGHKCYWTATPAGVQFYYACQVNRDLLEKAA